MSTIFASPEDAKSYLLACLHLKSEDVTINEEPELKAVGMEGCLLDDSDTSDEIKSAIKAKIAAQKGYSIETPKGKIRFVIGPFREGFDCMVSEKVGSAKDCNTSKSNPKVKALSR